MNLLPNNWTYAKINDLISNEGIFVDGDWIESKDQNPKGKVRLIQLADIRDGIFRDRSNRYLTKEKSVELGCTYLKKQDILVARLPEPLGRACIFPLNNSQKYITAVDICVIRPANKYVNIKYLLFLINSPIIRIEIDKLKSGTTRKRISRKNFAKIDFPIAPMNEQNCIVEKIEELFSDLDKATEDLKKSQEQLKIYRQAVLKKLLTNKNWKTQKLKNMCTITSSKRIFKKEYVDKGVPFYRTKEIVELSKGKKISFELYISSNRYNEIKDKFDIPTKGDILISAVGTIGISYIVPDNTPFYFKDGNILWIKNLKYLTPQFLNYILNHFVHSKIKNITAGTAYSALTIEKLKFLEVPTPTHDIQNQIVNEIESRLSVCDKLEETVQQSLKKIEYLRQSILKKAFEGKLVSQNPNDETAEKLLERIKQEKEKFESNNKKRKKR